MELLALYVKVREADHHTHTHTDDFTIFQQLAVSFGDAWRPLKIVKAAKKMKTIPVKCLYYICSLSV